MIDLCKTRWVERHTAFESFASLYTAIHDCLGQIAEDRGGWDSETITKAAGFLHSISSGEFLVGFVVCRKCLQFIQPLTVNLQKKAKDIVSAYKDLDDLSDSIKRQRRDIDAVFPVWFDEANEMSQNLVQADIQRPRHTGRQLLRENHPAENTEEFFKVAVAIPFLDSLSLQLTQRFQHSDLARDGLLLVPSNIVAQYPEGCTSLPNDHGIRGLASLWETDLEDIELVESEFVRWSNKWNNVFARDGSVPETLTEAIKKCDVVAFPNVHKLLHLMLTLPITTAECERSMSRLRILKNYLRSTMKSERFNGLTLMKLHHQKYPVDLNAAIDTFARRYKTKMALLPLNLLNEENIE